MTDDDAHSGDERAKPTSESDRPSKKSAPALVAVPNIDFHAKRTTAPSNDQICQAAAEEGVDDVPQTTVLPPIPIANDPQYHVPKETVYNLYASSFIPMQLKKVNVEHGAIIESVSRHYIDYGEYVRSFVGYQFLPQRLTAPFGYWAHIPQPTRSLSEASYLEHYLALCNIEIQAKSKQCKDFSLYMKVLNPIHASDGQELFALNIPGLREDNPAVEMGDVLELRQLWVDVNGYLLDDDSGPCSHGFSSTTWTGYIYRASVHGIHRATETVYLRADGLKNLKTGFMNLPIFVNVVFHQKWRVINACRDSLVLIDHALKDSKPTQQAHLKPSAYLDQHMIPLHYPGTDGYDHDLNNHSENLYLQHDWIRRMLFPVQADGVLQTELRKIPHRGLFDPEINYEQAHAVNSVCSRDYGNLPYLISGPPGTGKTKTVVEIAMQLLNSHEANHILICAPSDQAADTLTLRLKKYLDPTQLLRLNGPWRADNEVSPQLSPHTYMEDDIYYLPPFKMLMSYNVVVTSCRDAAMLMYTGLTNTDLYLIEKDIMSTFNATEAQPLPKLHWDALLLDEAAQATEFDIAPALSVICPPSVYSTHLPQPRFVMAGDERQLGPKTASGHPQFSTSLMARLLNMPIYKNHPLSRSNSKPSTSAPVLKREILPMLYPPFTNLIRNYRSHPAILSVPSTLFYNDTLLPEAAIPDTPLQTCALWQGRKWPVLFIPQIAHDDIEREGGGWYNFREAFNACNVAEYLITHAGVDQKDVCIMSPFAAQVNRLRGLARSTRYNNGAGYWEINIGPLEAFQGLESRVVIITCTRASRRMLRDKDMRTGQGIVHQPRRLNVALTRAKEALIVIGNPDLLAEDEHWIEWMGFCWRNGLVWDPHGLYAEDMEKSGLEKKILTGGKIGVLEKALRTKEDEQKAMETGMGKVLGGGAASSTDGIDGSYELWLEALKEAMEEEAAKEDEEVEENDSGYEGRDDDGSKREE